MSKPTQSTLMLRFQRVDWPLVSLAIIMGAPEGYFWSINHGCTREIMLFPGYMAAICLFNFAFRRIMKLFLAVNAVAFIVELYFFRNWVYSIIALFWAPFPRKIMYHCLFVLIPALLVFSVLHLLQKQKSRPEPLRLWTRSVIFLVAYGLYLFVLIEKIPIWIGWNCQNLH